MKSSELKTIRSDTGLSRNKFSRKLGVAESTIQKWELSESEGGNPIPEWGSNLIKLTFPENS